MIYRAKRVRTFFHWLLQADSSLPRLPSSAAAQHVVLRPLWSGKNIDFSLSLAPAVSLPTPVFRCRRRFQSPFLYGNQYSHQMSILFLLTLISLKYFSDSRGKIYRKIRGGVRSSSNIATPLSTIIVDLIDLQLSHSRSQRWMIHNSHQECQMIFLNRL